MSPFTFRSAPVFSPKALLVMPVIGALIGLMGPYDSYAWMPLVARVAHFALCVSLIGTMVMTASYLAARSLFQGFWPLWAALCLDLVLTLPAATIVWASLALISPDSAAKVQFGNLLWQNLLVMLLFRIASLFASWQRIRGGALNLAPAEPSKVPSELEARLPFGLRRSIVLALSAEDHYLRVHTPDGEALIHMTLARAAASLGDGFQIHRSHWVLRQGIAETFAARVKLRTGLSLPVSRQRAKAFREWLDQAG